MNDERLEYLRDMVVETALDRYMLLDQMTSGDELLLTDLMAQYRASSPVTALIRCELQLATASRLYIARDGDTWDLDDDTDFWRLKQGAFTVRGETLEGTKR